MAEAPEISELLTQPAVIAAVRELAVDALETEDVLRALRRFGEVRVEVGTDARRPFVCVLQVAGEDPEAARGRTVFHAALACWAATLASFANYTDRGFADVERFLATDADEAG
jgi:hypothetical protein